MGNSKLLARARDALLAYSKALNLGVTVSTRSEEDIGEILVISNGWFEVFIENRKLNHQPFREVEYPHLVYPHLVVYEASYTPATRWEPEDVDVSEVAAFVTPTSAASFIAKRMVDNVINGVTENLMWGFDEQDRQDGGEL